MPHPSALAEAGKANSSATSAYERPRAPKSWNSVVNINSSALVRFCRSVRPVRTASRVPWTTAPSHPSTNSCFSGVYGLCLAGDRLLSEVLADAGFGSISGLLAQLSDLMEAAKATGMVHADAMMLDLRVVLRGMAVQLIRTAERDPALWRRYDELALQALRP
ncbi:hypothetical protein [Streptomyces sp. NPDC050564]|uniref:hypothetical protein n=1 Tax=Streptomyces sp. NPDC050564 TaxID=3365631 RepID=UPI0037A45EC4